MSSGLYITTIRNIEAHSVAGLMPEFQDMLLLRHDRLGHPGRDMMRRILKSSPGISYIPMLDSRCAMRVL